jgi:hypothetical protein
MTVGDRVQRTLHIRDSVSINQLSTGVHGLDEVLGGGIPEHSFNLIAGAPGTGKTTLSQQIILVWLPSSGRRCTSPPLVSRQSGCWATSSNSPSSTQPESAALFTTSTE